MQRYPELGRGVKSNEITHRSTKCSSSCPCSNIFSISVFLVDSISWKAKCLTISGYYTIYRTSHSLIIVAHCVVLGRSHCLTIAAYWVTLGKSHSSSTLPHHRISKKFPESQSVIRGIATLLAPLLSNSSFTIHFSLVSWFCQL